MVDYGQLLVAMNAVGINKTLNKLEEFQKQMGGTFKSVKPQLEQLTKGFAKFAAISLFAFSRLIEASPRLRAQMEILNFRVNTLIRGFGDALAPAIELVSDSIADLTEWFKRLPEPIQEAIFFGGALTIGVGLLTGAFIALNAAMGPITLIVLGIAAAAALLFLAWDQNLGGIQEITAKVIGNIQVLFTSLEEAINALLKVFGFFGEESTDLMGIVDVVFGSVFQGFATYLNNFIAIVTDVVNIFTALISGDMVGVLEGLDSLVNNIIKGLIDSFLNLPIQIKSVFDHLWVIFKAAGIDIAQAFVEGLVKGIEDGISIVQDALEGLAGLFGGSLPEWGPLKDALPGGGDMANKYFNDMATQIINSKGLLNTALLGASEGFTEPAPFQGVTPGFGAEATRVEHRTIIIENIELVIPGATTDSATGFLNRLDTEVRRATKF